MVYLKIFIIEYQERVYHVNKQKKINEGIKEMVNKGTQRVNETKIDL